MTAAETFTSTDLEEARSLLVSEIASRISHNENEVRVRIHWSGHPDHVWFYSRLDNEWVKEPRVIDNPALAAAMNDLLQMLASRGKTDELSIRLHRKHDLADTDLQFDPEWLATHRGPHLESYVMGVLFRDPHASENDRRRSVRPGHEGHK